MTVWYFAVFFLYCICTVFCNYCLATLVHTNTSIRHACSRSAPLSALITKYQSIYQVAVVTLNFLILHSIDFFEPFDRWLGMTARTAEQGYGSLGSFQSRVCPEHDFRRMWRRRNRSQWAVDLLFQV
jgi:hypothetical protein